MTIDAATEESAAPDMDRVIARIQKLLARTKTDRGATEAEADTALKMAQELMAKHNLDMAVVEAAASKAGNATSVERVKESVSGRAMYKWQRQLARYVAEANWCYHLIKLNEDWIERSYKPDVLCIKAAGKAVKDFKASLTRTEYWELAYEDQKFYKNVDGHYKRSHSHVFVGRKGNVITAQLMYQYLTQTIEDNVPVTDNTQRLSRSAMSWKEGCADRLCERLAKRRQDLIKAHDTRVKQQEADDLAERKARAQAAREAAGNKPKAIAADHGTEVKAHYEMAGADAYDRTGAKPEAEEQDRPEADENDTWTPGDNAEEVPEVDPGSAMVLASVYDESEREANYEIAHGYEPGTMARWRTEREEEKRQEAAERAKEQVDAVEAPVVAETERQRKAREKREADNHAKNRRRWAREDAAAWRREQNEHAKRDHRAYNAGAEKGKDIGLDVQISRNNDSTKKLR